MRYEKKLLIRGKDEYLTEVQILTLPFSFFKPFPDRRIHNVYFDTIDYQCYQDNKAGNSDRTKIRFRWYDDYQQRGNWELKIKQGLVSKKETIPSACTTPALKALKNEIGNIDLGFKIDLFPTLYNTYARKYFESFDRKIRITIDFDLKFCHPEAILDASLLAPLPHILMEIKYDPSESAIVEQLNNYISLTPSRHSKYIIGMDTIGRQ
ncbi:MAG: VTC domain-containing protein [Saprospiraceae bacterium]|nr:VTC domain-containing protein [Saprospiraceae bacterium]